MKGIRLVVFLLCAPILANADERKGVNAGVIPFACTAEGAHYLLAYDPHPNRKAWGTFGGQPKGMESASQTALRELREETNCVYDEKTIQGLVLRGPSQSGSFYSYVAEVPFRTVADIALPRDCSDVERAFWVWVPHQQLMSALNSRERSPAVELPDKPNATFYLWDGAAKSLRKARSDGCLTKEDPCHPSQVAQVRSGPSALHRSVTAAQCQPLSKALSLVH